MALAIGFYTILKIAFLPVPDPAERRSVDDAQYEQLRNEYAITSMVDTDHGLQLRRLSEQARTATDAGIAKYDQ